MLSDEVKREFSTWTSASLGDLRLKRNSGLGGSLTFKIAIGEAGEAAVCVHLFGPTFALATPVDDAFKTRVRKAHAAFSAVGIAAPRLGEWEGGFIEPWLPGGAVGAPMGEDWAQALSEENCEAIGALLASVHAVDKAWFTEIREGVMSKHPQLAEAGIGAESYLWNDTGLVLPPLTSWLDKATLELFESTGPFPASAAGKAIVTTHGDFHLANILVGGRTRWDSSDPSATLHLGTTGAKVCDFENSGVGPAVGDLTYGLKMWCTYGVGLGTSSSKSHSQLYSYRCAVCRGYLKALEKPAEEEDIFALLLDVERCSLRFIHPVTVAIPETGTPPLGLPTLHGWWFDVRRNPFPVRSVLSLTLAAW
jgi:hypothetical protein